MWGRKVRKYRFFFILMMYLSLYDYQAKASRCRKGVNILEDRETTNQNQTLHSQKLKNTQHKLNGNHPTKKERNKGET